MNELVVKKLSSVSSGINLAQIPPIHQKRLLTFVNHFIITTVNLLNNFAQTCERKLLECNRKMQKLEAELCILEAKLNSIPGLEDAHTTTSAAITPDKDETDKPPDIPSNSIPATAIQEEVPGEVQTEECDSAPAPEAKHPELAKFLRMVQVGVPVPAVKQKMQQEGVDPSLLDS